MRQLCSRCNLEIPKDFPDVEGRLCPSCYRKVDGACMRCGDGPVEIVEIHRVYGLLAIGFSGKRTLVLCMRCTRWMALKNLIYTGLFGWLGITPFYKSFKGQRANLRSLFKHPSLPPATRPMMTFLAFLVPIGGALALVAFLIFGGLGSGASGPSLTLSEDVKALLETGEGELHAGHPDRAEMVFRKAVVIAPDNPKTRFSLGNALERQGRRKDAEREYRRALRLLEGFPYPRLYRNLGNLLLRTDRAVEAVALLKPEVERLQSPEAYRMHLALHRLYQDAMRRAGRSSEALADYRERLVRCPGDAALLYLVGRLESKEEPGRAAARFEEALNIDDGFFEPAYALGRLRLEQGALEEAIEWFRKALDIREDSRQVLFSLGEAHGLRGDLDGAGRAFARIADLYPASALGHLGLGSVALWRGDPDAARSLLEEAVKRPGDAFSLAEALLLTAMTCVLGNRPEEAKKHFEAALAAAREGKQKARIAVWAAAFAVRLPGNEGAVDHWRRARAVEENAWTGCVARLWLEEIEEKAFLEAFEKASLRPFRGFAAYFAGLRRWHAGERERAEPLFQRARETGPPLIGALIESLGTSKKD